MLVDVGEGEDTLDQINRIERAGCWPVVVVAAAKCLNDVITWGNDGLFILRCCDAHPREV